MSYHSYLENIGSERFNQALKDIENFPENLRPLQDIFRAEIAITKRQLEKAKDILNEFSNNTKPSSLTEFLRYTLLAEIEHYDRNYELSETYVEKALSQVGNLDHYKNGDQKALLISKFQGEVYNTMGLNHSIRGEFQEALKAYQRSLNIIEELPTPSDLQVHHIFNNIAICYFKLGDAERSIKLHKKVEKIRRDKEKYVGLAYTYNSLLHAHLNLGDIDSAMSYFERFNEVIKDEKYDADAPPSLCHAGYIFQLLRDFDRAEELYNRNLNNYEDLNNEYELVRTHFQLYRLCKELDRTEDVKFHYQFIIDHTGHEDDRILKLVEMTRAIQKYFATRIAIKFQAIPVFYRIMNDPHVDPSLRSIAMTYLAQLLLEELKLTRDKETEKEFLRVIREIKNFAEARNFSILETELQIIKAQYHIIIDNPLKATKLLVIAQETALENKYVILAQKISDIHDKFANLLELDDLISEEFVIREEEKNQILSDFRTSKSTDQIYPKVEKPILLLFINESGMVKYQNHFEPGNRIHTDLMASFLTAMQSFGDELFEGRKYMERIKYQNYTIIVRLVKNILITYVIDGPSYHASQKLSRLADILQSREQLLTRLNEYKDPGKDVINELENIIQQVLL